MKDRYVGKWWRADGVGQPVAGELRLDGEGPARLELHERLTVGAAELDELGIVLGTSLEGDLLTLQRVWSLGTSSHSSRKFGATLEREVLSPQVVYVGAHLPGEEERRFRHAIIDLLDLAAWAGPSGLSDDLAPGLDGATVRLELPPRLAANVPGARVALARGWSVTGDGLHRRGIEVTVGFVVDAEVARGVDAWLADYIGPLRHLLTFTTDRANEVTELRLKGDSADPRDVVDVEVWFPRERPLAQPADHGFDFLVVADDLAADFESLLRQWFKLCRETGTAIDALLGQLYRPKTFMDNHFLNACAAAEGYHRAKYGNTVLPKADHKAMVARIVAAVPAEDQPWLKERLAYSNEPTFRMRLEELHARAFDVVAGVVGTASSFAEPVVAARNKLTHRGKGSPTGAVTGQEMYRLMLATRFVLTSCLLLDLGLGEMHVVNATRRWRVYRMLDELDRRSRQEASASRSTS